MNPLEGLKAAMATVDAYYKERGIFQARFGYGVCPALIVIDMAYGWTDPAYAGGSARLDPAIEAIRQLLPAARAKQVPIYYTTSAYDEKPQFKSAADYSPKFRKWDRRACEIDERVNVLRIELIDDVAAAAEANVHCGRRHLCGQPRAEIPQTHRPASHCPLHRSGHDLHGHVEGSLLL